MWHFIKYLTATVNHKINWYDWKFHNCIYLDFIIFTNKSFHVYIYIYIYLLNIGQGFEESKCGFGFAVVKHCDFYLDNSKDGL